MLAGFLKCLDGSPTIVDKSCICTSPLSSSSPCNFNLQSNTGQIVWSEFAQSMPLPPPSLSRSLGALQVGKEALQLDVWIEATGTSDHFPAHILIDSGASGNFINDGLLSNYLLS
jgi:hypothetical protein